MIVMVLAAVDAAGVSVVAAATAEQNDDENDPKTGIIVVSIVKAHDCHLALRHSMHRCLIRGLTP